jgi:Tol biopolymer transport system component
MLSDTGRSNPAIEVSPAWSPDGKKIAFQGGIYPDVESI